MAKNLFQDMIKVRNTERVIHPKIFTEKETPKKKPADYYAPKEIRQETQREIPKKEFSRREIPKFEQRYKEPPRYFGGRDSSHSGDKKPQYGLWFVAFISIIFFLFALSFFFAKAEVVVTPKIQDFTLSENLSAVKDSNPNGLAFDLVIISGEETKSVVAGAQQNLNLSSKGTVLIYNTFSPDPQKLSINTSLEGSNGKIYKTTTAVVVPGANIDGTPGKVEVGISGAQPGEEYNSAPLDFKLLGFKGTSKYNKFYARSEGEITGGFKGMAGAIADADKEAAFNDLKTTLQAKLLQKATDQIPNGFILFKDAAFLNINSKDVDFKAAVAGDNTLPLTIKGTLYGFLLNEKELTAKIAKDNIEDYKDEPVYIPNIRDLTFALTDQTTSYNDVQNINFSLSGSAKVVWRFDGDKFSEDLLGRSKSEFNQILSGYHNADSAKLSVSPFWIRTLPSKLKDIKVRVDYPQ